MKRIESELRSALGRRPAPPGFAARVLSRVARLPRSGPSVAPGFPARRLWAVAAVVTLALGLGLIEQQRRAERRSRVALQETLAALQIAATELDRAQSRALSPSRWQRLGQQLQRAGVPWPPQPSAPSAHSTGSAPRI